MVQMKEGSRVNVGWLDGTNKEGSRVNVGWLDGTMKEVVG